MMAEMELGRTRREALLGLSARAPLETLRTVVTSVISAEELGTPLSEIFREVPPFILAMLAIVVLVTFFPDLALFVPRAAGLIKP